MGRHQMAVWTTANIITSHLCMYASNGMLSVTGECIGSDLGPGLVVQTAVIAVARGDVLYIRFTTEGKEKCTQRYKQRENNNTSSD